MAADRDEICAQTIRPKRNLQKCLHRVRVQQRLTAGRPHAFGDLCDIRDGAGLVVDHHERYEHGIRLKHLDDLLRIDPAQLVGLEAGDLEALFFQHIQRTANRVVLCHGADHVHPAASHHMRPGEDRPVVALGSAGGKINVFRSAAQRIRDLTACVINCGFCVASQRIGRARVPVFLCHHPQRCLCSFGTDACSGGIVKIAFHRK